MLCTNVFIYLICVKRLQLFIKSTYDSMVRIERWSSCRPSLPKLVPTFCYGLLSIIPPVRFVVNHCSINTGYSLQHTYVYILINNCVINASYCLQFMLVLDAKCIAVLAKVLRIQTKSLFLNILHAFLYIRGWLPYMC